MENLNPQSVEAVVEELLEVTGQLLRRLRAESNPSELSWSQLAAIKQLDKSGAMTTADLARAQSVKPQSMGVTLASLEQDGMVSRQANPDDGRQVLFSLTDVGTAIRRKHRLLRREWLSSAMDQLDDEERRTLATALGLIRRLGETGANSSVSSAREINALPRA